MGFSIKSIYELAITCMRIVIVMNDLGARRLAYAVQIGLIDTCK